MKNILFVTAIMSICILTSCKKDRVCECTANILGETISENFVLEDKSRSEAREACEDAEAGAKAAAALFGGSASCTLN